MFRSVILLASLAVAAAACSSGSGSSGGGNGGSGGSNAGTGGTGATTSGGSCESECDREVAAGCSNMPPDFASSCKTLCSGMRQSLPPECVPKFDAVYACAASKVTYTCTSSGTVQPTPSGACAAEGAACLSCSSSCLPGV